MESIKIYNKNKNIQNKISITGSKSESNRLLIINALYQNIINIKNISNSEDTNIIKKIIKNQNNKIHNVKHAGTAMRFLCSYFSVIQQNQDVLLTGSRRMQNRPIRILVDALTYLGIKIKYIKNYGYPPIKIYNTEINKNILEMNAETSSQYISSLMLIGSKLVQGLRIKLLGNITSKPYINMTFVFLKKLGIPIFWNNNEIIINYHKNIEKQNITIESDWSSASYFYSIVAISNNACIELNTFNIKSLQGDHVVYKIYKKFFGVDTKFYNNKIILNKKYTTYPNNILLNLQDTPDIAQTIIVTCVALKIKCKLTGLHTLKIKETDRLEGLKKELKKLGVETKTTHNSIEIINFNKIENPNIYIETYNDHRMAMSFSPISLLYPIHIKNPKVVKKSYPNFWKDLKKLNFHIQTS